MFGRINASYSEIAQVALTIRLKHFLQLGYRPSTNLIVDIADTFDCWLGYQCAQNRGKCGVCETIVVKIDLSNGNVGHFFLLNRM